MKHHVVSIEYPGSTSAVERTYCICDKHGDAALIANLLSSHAKNVSKDLVYRVRIVD